MTQTITYHSNNAAPHEAWSAYVVLPTGKRWGVVAFGETEEQAINKIVSLYEAEKLKVIRQQSDEPWTAAVNRGHHFAGKVWMIHSFTKAKQRVNPNEVAKYEAEGWVKGGPRSK